MPENSFPASPGASLRSGGNCKGDDMGQENLQKLFEQSANTDMAILLTAKENAKRAVLDSATPANLAAFERASRLVEDAMEKSQSFRDYKEVLAYAEEKMRKVKRSKLYRDIREGRLKRQPDGSFKNRDVDRYLATLPYSGTPDPVYDKAAERQRQKEEQEIRRLRAAADNQEFDLAVKRGRYVPKEQVHLELAGRAVTLASSLKTAFEASSLDLVECVGGNPKKGASLLELLERILDEAFNEYSREMEIALEFESEQGNPGDNQADREKDS